jgi:hypothetical protein
MASGNLVRSLIFRLFRDSGEFGTQDRLCVPKFAFGKKRMHMWLKLFPVIFHLGIASAIGSTRAHAQTRIALKSGESVELQIVYWVTNCRSIMVGIPEIEVLEGPPEVTLAIKEGMVLPRRFNCANRVPGGTILATAKDVKEPVETKLTYRVKYKTKDGDRQTSSVYNVSLFP